MLAGVFTTVIVAPGERIKCLLQAGQTHYCHKYTCVHRHHSHGNKRLRNKKYTLTLKKQKKQQQTKEQNFKQHFISSLDVHSL